jgi:hypothetical protein
MSDVLAWADGRPMASIARIFRPNLPGAFPFMRPRGCVPLLARPASRRFCIDNSMGEQAVAHATCCGVSRTKPRKARPAWTRFGRAAPAAWPWRWWAGGRGAGSRALRFLFLGIDWLLNPSGGLFWLPKQGESWDRLPEDARRMGSRKTGTRRRTCCRCLASEDGHHQGRSNRFPLLPSSVKKVWRPC